jgi:hypothetical protein
LQSITIYSTAAALAAAAALVPELDELQRILARLQLALDVSVITAAEYATKRAKVIEDSL